MNILRITLAQLLAISGIWGFYQAYQWIEVGYGINPFIAIPLALLAFILPYPVTVRK